MLTSTGWFVAQPLSIGLAGPVLIPHENITSKTLVHGPGAYCLAYNTHQAIWRVVELRTKNGWIEI